MIKRYEVVLLFLALAIVRGQGLWAQELDARQEGRLSQTLQGETVFEINGSQNLSGSIGIVAESSDEIEVSFVKTARAQSRPQAERFLDLIDLRMAARGDDRVVLDILTPSDSPWEGTEHAASIDIVIGLPEKMRIEGELRLMKINISGPFGGVKLRSQFSALSIDGTRGEVDITTAFSPIALSEIEGEIRAETRYGPISASGIIVPLGSAVFKTVNGAIALTDIQGPVEAYTSYSKIRASDIDAAEGSIVFRTSYSPIDIEDISGELICETSFSPINIRGATLNHGQSKLETSYSPIDAEFDEIEDCQLIVYNSYNNIKLSIPADISAQIIADVDQGGRIHASGVPVRPIYIDVTRLEGFLGDGQSRIETKVSGVGTIEIEGQ
jgi:hypothetical protein